MCTIKQMYDIIKQDGDNMYNYITGEIVEQTSSLIVVDNNGIGYDVFVSNPYAFELNKKMKVYIYHHIFTYRFL